MDKSLLVIVKFRVTVKFHFIQFHFSIYRLGNVNVIVIQFENIEEILQLNGEHFVCFVFSNFAEKSSVGDRIPIKLFSLSLSLSLSLSHMDVCSHARDKTETSKSLTGQTKAFHT